MVCIPSTRVYSNAESMHNHDKYRFPDILVYGVFHSYTLTGICKSILILKEMVFVLSAKYQNVL